MGNLYPILRTRGTRGQVNYMIYMPSYYPYLSEALFLFQLTYYINSNIECTEWTNTSAYMWRRE